MWISKTWNGCIASCYSDYFIILSIPTQITHHQQSLHTEVRARGSRSLTFYSLLTPHWLYECQLSLPLWHSPHPLLQHSSHQQRQNKGRPTCYYYWMTGINHTIPSCHQWQGEEGRGKFGDGKTNNPWYSRMAAPSDELCLRVCVNECTHNTSPSSILRRVTAHLLGCILNGPSSAISRCVYMYTYVSVFNYKLIHAAVCRH